MSKSQEDKMEVNKIDANKTEVSGTEPDYTDHNKAGLYQEAYRIIGRHTPLKSDCGALCGKTCCQGDGETGMYLFPGEEAVYETLPGCLSLKATDFLLENGRKILLAVCSGTCQRELRPLACRIFPLFPYLTGEGILTIRMDMLAGSVCPIARCSQPKELNQDFVKSVRQAARMLIEDYEVREFIEKLTLMRDELAALRGLDKGLRMKLHKGLPKGPRKNFQPNRTGGRRP